MYWGPNSKPNSTDVQLDTFHYLCPRRVSWEGPQRGPQQALTYDLTLTYVDWVAILIENS